jgi:hypothetical protein
VDDTILGDHVFLLNRNNSMVFSDATDSRWIYFVKSIPARALIKQNKGDDSMQLLEKELTATRF